MTTPEKKDLDNFDKEVETFIKAVSNEPKITAIICRRGAGRPRNCQSCGLRLYAGGILCDFAVGDGKTCDRFECRKCSRRVGENLDYCSKHKEEKL